MTTSPKPRNNVTKSPPVREFLNPKTRFSDLNTRVRGGFLSRYCSVLEMLSFILKRLLHMIPLLLGVSLLTFLLMALSPGNYFTTLQQNPQISQETIAQLKAQFHL